jgi:hypothetical protein
LIPLFILRTIAVKVGSLSEHRLEAYATLIFRTIERSPKTILGTPRDLTIASTQIGSNKAEEGSFVISLPKLSSIKIEQHERRDQEA